jgi:hypothetical protein
MKRPTMQIARFTPLLLSALASLSSIAQPINPSPGPPIGHCVGDYAPNFLAVDQFGKRRALSEFRGQFIILDFSGMWCPPCNVEAQNAESPLEQALRQAGIPFVWITVLLSNRFVLPATPADALAWATRYRLTGPVLNPNGSSTAPCWAEFASYTAAVPPPGDPSTELYPSQVVLGPDLKVLDIDQGLQGNSTDNFVDVTGFVNFYMDIIESSIAANPLYQILVAHP